ncbi:MAG: shikimate kinase [bacterium]
MNIVLTGFMGTGKTVVGKLLAKKLSYQYIDSDEMIEKDVGMSISKIFKYKGEAFFREVESKAILLVSLLDKFIVATGGGVPLKSINMDELEKKGFIVCLKAKAQTIFDRVKDDNSRPLLQTEEPLKEIQKLLKQREEYYKRCDFSVDTDAYNVEKVADIIIEKFNEKNNN